MRKCTLVVIALAVVVLPGAETVRAPLSSLAAFMPPHALLYLESPNFQPLLARWNDSTAKRVWLRSDNYQAFARSRLFLKLREVQKEWAQAAGLKPDIPFLRSVAGGLSALALYDVGRLEFLYITQIPQARIAESILWKSRGKFVPRKIGSVPYYVYSDPAKGRAVAFATTRGRLLIATREDLLTGSLQLFAGGRNPSLSDERWFRGANQAFSGRADLRMALNMQALARSPHFRSYWIQRNVPELRQYESEFVSLTTLPNEFRENRTLLRMNNDEVSHRGTSSTPDALGTILRFVPANAGLFRAWSSPSVNQAVALLKKVLAPEIGPPPASRFAPVVALTEGQTGSAADLETRIDVAPPATDGGAFNTGALASLLRSQNLQAALEIASAHQLAVGPLVEVESAIVLESSTGWNGDAVRSALIASNRWTTSGLGAAWVKREQRGWTWYGLNGLCRLAMGTQGKFLIVASAPPSLLDAMAAQARTSAVPSTPQAIYAAGFRHELESKPLAEMLSFVEGPSAARIAAFRSPGTYQPLFFSQNLRSLSQTLNGIGAESILVRDQGNIVLETVRYQLAKR